MTGILAIVMFRVLAEFGVGWVELGRSFCVLLWAFIPKLPFGVTL